jgi:hypothetical protein
MTKRQPTTKNSSTFAKWKSIEIAAFQEFVNFLTSRDKQKGGTFAISNAPGALFPEFKRVYYITHPDDLQQKMGVGMQNAEQTLFVFHSTFCTLSRSQFDRQTPCSEESG